MKKLVKLALLATLAFNTLTPTSQALDLGTQIGLLVGHMNQVKEMDHCPINPVSLPAPFYGVLDEALATLSQPCAGEECQDWAKNGNGKRLPDPVLYLLKADIDTFHQQQNLNIFQWNVFFFRLAMHLSIYPEKGYHPITKIYKERAEKIENPAVYGNDLSGLFELPTVAAFNEVFSYQNQTVAYMRACPPILSWYNSHIEWPRETTMSIDQSAYAQLGFSLWDQDLTIADINHMNALDIFPLAVSRRLEEHYDGVVNHPLRFLQHDMIHRETQMLCTDREKFREIYWTIKALEKEGLGAISLPKLDHYSFGHLGGEVPLSTAFQMILFLADHEGSYFPSVKERFERLMEISIRECSDRDPFYYITRFYPIFLDLGIVAETLPSREWPVRISMEEVKDLHEGIFAPFYEAFEARFSHLMK